MSRRHNAAHFPRRTVRLRLTLLYGSMFVGSGALLLAITNLLVRRATDFVFVQSRDESGTTGIIAGSGAPPAEPPQDPGTPGFNAQHAAQQVLSLVHRQHAHAMHQLLVESFVTLAIMSVVSIWLGWFVAGRTLRPLRTITAAARDISSSNLHERLALTGPDDELKELGDTFDALIARLERSFQSQRQFVANASHELRTPLTLQHALLEAALLDPNASLETWQATGERALAASQEQERLIAALLTLARSDRGLSQHEALDLSALATTVLNGRHADAKQRGVHVSARLDPAPTLGDPELAERLVANLIDNALRHNVADGRVEVVTETSDDHALFSVRNTGPILASSDIVRLFEPFQRADVDRTRHDGGLGLGLSIVQAIATAHDAAITARAQPEGGLAVVVRFPIDRSRAPASADHGTTLAATAARAVRQVPTRTP
jgi:signal transduction histidine kinase